MAAHVSADQVVAVGADASFIDSSEEMYIDYQSWFMFAKSPVKPVSYFRRFVVPPIPFTLHIIINLSFIITLQSDVNNNNNIY